MKVIKTQLIFGSVLSATFLLSGCFHEKEDAVDDFVTVTPSPYYAVISTSDYTNSDVSIVSMIDYSVEDDVFNTQADIDVATSMEDIYVISRLGTDNIAKYNIEASGIVRYQYQYALEQYSNPYEVIVKDSSTAYIISYAKDTILVVNPSATAEVDFETGVTFDLSPYNDADGAPEAADAVLVEDNLFVILQSWDKSNGWPWTAGDSYVVIFDTSTGLEIDTNDDVNTLNGIKLKTKNPLKMVYESVSGKIYIASRGSDFTGGIEVVDATSYVTSIVVDDGSSATSTPYGAITNVAILSASRGYFIGSASYQNDSLYSFNPTDGTVDSQTLLSGSDIADIAVGPLGNLWVTDRTNSGVIVYDTSDNSVFKSLIVTDLPPTNIEFISVPQ